MAPFFDHAIHQTSGFIQGCSFSVILADAIMNVLRNYLVFKIPDIHLRTYIGDTTIWQISLKWAITAIKSTAHIDKLVGLFCNFKKTICIGASSGRKKQIVRLTPLILWDIPSATAIKI
jgi:hypothetical protein